MRRRISIIKAKTFKAKFEKNSKQNSKKFKITIFELLSLYNLEARAARALTGRYTTQQTSKTARRAKGSPNQVLHAYARCARGCIAKPVYLCARGSNWDGRLCSVPPGRAQREPQGYAGLTSGCKAAIFSATPWPRAARAKGPGQGNAKGYTAFLLSS